MGPIRNPNWSTSGISVTLSYLHKGVILKSAWDRLGTGNNAHRIGILFKSNTSLGVRALPL